MYDDDGDDDGDDDDVDDDDDVLLFSVQSSGRRNVRKQIIAVNQWVSSP